MLPCFAGLDEAKLILLPNRSIGQRVLVYGQDSNCYDCSFNVLANFSAGGALEAQYATVPVAHAYLMYFTIGEDTSTIEAFELGDRGVYIINGSFVLGQTMKVVALVEPFNTWLPIVVALMVYAGAACLYVPFHFLVWKRFFDKKKGPPKTEEEVSLVLNDGNKEGGASAAGDGVEGGKKTSVPRSSQRLFSVDTFRGCCLAVMIFVNYHGGSYWFFNHSVWNGLTVADLVFPWFVFLMGVSMSLSFSSILSKGALSWGEWASFWYKIIRRTVILFGLGLIINNCYYVEHCRIPGVLQRFAVSYLVCAVIVVAVPRFPRCIWQSHTTHKFSSFVDVYVSRLWEWIVISAIVALWLVLTFLLPVPGCPTGYLGAGGTAQLDPSLAGCTGGAAAHIDRLVFGLAHIYQTPTCQTTYGTGAYDPEGLLGCLTSIFICYAGVHAGRLLVAYRRDRLAVMYAHLATCGVVFGLVGTILCAGSQNNGVIPICKNLWSLSFVLVMAGTGYLAIVLFHIIVDVKSWWNGAPFRYLGMNSIAIYVSHEILSQTFPFGWDYAPYHGASLLRSLTGATLWTLIAFYMHTIQFYVKI